MPRTPPARPPAWPPSKHSMTPWRELIGAVSYITAFTSLHSLLAPTDVSSPPAEPVARSIVWDLQSCRSRHPADIQRRPGRHRSKIFADGRLNQRRPGWYAMGPGSASCDPPPLRWCYPTITRAFNSWKSALMGDRWRPPMPTMSYASGICALSIRDRNVLVLRDHKATISYLQLAPMGASWRLPTIRTSRCDYGIFGGNSSVRMRLLRGHKAAISALEFGPDRQLASGDESGTVRLWALPTANLRSRRRCCLTAKSQF